MPENCNALFLMFVLDLILILSFLLLSSVSTLFLFSDGLGVRAGGRAKSEDDRWVSTGWPPISSS